MNVSNVVYIKEFSNGKKYVGITSDFNRRMRQHTASSKKENPKCVVHRAMNKYDHYTDTVFESEDYDEVLAMEIIVIQNFKDLGYELYNITNGGEGSLGVIVSDSTREKMSVSQLGMVTSDHSKAKMSLSSRKPMAYYEKSASQRTSFKRTCRIQCWNFDDFIETYSGKKDKNIKKYYYVKSGGRSK